MTYLPAGALIPVGAQGNGAIVTALGNGGFVAAWYEQNQATGEFDVRAQIFDSAGAKVGSVFTLSSTTAGYQSNPQIAATANGGFVAVWLDNGTDGGDIHMRRFDAIGTPLGTETIVPLSTGRPEHDATVETRPDGSFVVSWVESLPNNFQRAVFASFDASGNRIGGEFVATSGQYGGSDASVALLGSGAILVASTATGGQGLVGRLYAYNPVTHLPANATGTTFQINNSALEVGSPTDISTVALADGGFAVVWADFAAPSGFATNYGVFARVFNADGSARGAQFEVADYAPMHVYELHLSALPTGGFAVSWDQRDPNDNGTSFTMVQAFDAAGASDGAAVRIDGGLAGGGTAAEFAVLADGRLAAIFADMTGLQLRLLAAADPLQGTEGDDVLTGTPNADTIHGLGGNDIIDPGLGADIVDAGAGDDTIVFHSVSVTNQTLPVGSVDGGTGYDTLDLSHVQPVQVGTIFDGANNVPGVYVGSQRFSYAGIEEILLGSGNDSASFLSATGITLHAGNGDDSIHTYGNRIFGEGGNDFLFISGAFGTSFTGLVDGGAGIDTLGLNVQFTVDLAAGTAVAGGANYTIAGVENVSAYRDSVVRGDDGDNVFSVRDLFDAADGAVTFEGRGGNDTLTGSMGNDTLNGGSGNDVLDGRAGADSMTGGTGDDSFHVDNVGDVVIEAAGEGTDTVITTIDYTLGANLENLRAGSGITAYYLSLTGNALNNIIYGNDTSQNSLHGGDGDDELHGGSRDDTLIGEGGNDRLYGGLGDDTYLVENAGDQIFELAGEGRDTLLLATDYVLAEGVSIELVYTSEGTGWPTNPQPLGFTGNSFGQIINGNEAGNRIDGGGGNDTLYGRGGNDTLIGGAGYDTLIGGAGADTLIGGADSDSYEIDAFDTIIELADEGFDTVKAGFNYTLTANVEALVLTGTANLNGDGNALANTIDGNSGANRLAGHDGNDILLGHDGDDVLVGGNGDDVLSGGNGVDSASYFDAGAGVTVDLAIVDNPQETGAGRDVLIGMENLEGSAFADVLYGDGGANVLTGNGGEDWLQGRAGNDMLIGGDGHDSLWGGDGDDLLDGGAGDDTIWGGAGNDTASYASAGGGVHVDLSWAEDQQTGGAGSDTLVSIENLTGSAYADWLAGDAGANQLRGGAGDDVLNGGGGNDTLFGDAGADLFVFGRGSGADTIADFAAGTDRIDLSAYGFASFAQLQAAMTSQGGGTSIALGNGNSVTLAGVSQAQLGAGDFLLTPAPAAALSDPLHLA